jgi:hypothetical protein
MPKQLCERMTMYLTAECCKSGFWLLLMQCGGDGHRSDNRTVVHHLRADARLGDKGTGAELLPEAVRRMWATRNMYAYVRAGRNLNSSARGLHEMVM